MYFASSFELQKTLIHSTLHTLDKRARSSAVRNSQIQKRQS